MQLWFEVAKRQEEAKQQKLKQEEEERLQKEREEIERIQRVKEEELQKLENLRLERERKVNFRSCVCIRSSHLSAFKEFKMSLISKSVKEFLVGSWWFASERRDGCTIPCEQSLSLIHI